jgi:DNA-binding transcriptional MerR regulator
LADVDDMVPIGTFARAARMTVKALRHYQREGLLEPTSVDPATGYRYYSWDQLGAAVRIASLRDLDISIDSIRSHLDGHLSMTQLAAVQRARRLDEIAVASTALAALDELIDGPELRSHPIDTIDVAETATWAITRNLDADLLDTGVVQLIDELLRIAAEADVETAPAVWGEYPIALSGVVAITVHLPIRESQQHRSIPSSITRGALPAGRYAKATHQGSTRTLPFAYRTLLAHLARHGREATGPVFERYVTDPTATRPADNVIEILHVVA